MLCRVRTTLADRPGALAAIARRCGDAQVNILGLQIFPDHHGVIDELVLRVPGEWTTADVAALVGSSGGTGISVGRCTAHSLTDAPTDYVRAAMRLLEDPQTLQGVLDDLLDADEWSEVVALQDRIEVGADDLRSEVRRAVPFTETERARASALGELAQRVLARRPEKQPPGSAAATPLPEASAGPLEQPVVRLGQVTDTMAVSEMHRRCSPAALFRRYHAPMPSLSWRSLRRLLAPPGGVSLLALVGADVVGMAVVAPYAAGRMEVGVLVEDRWQRRGIGSGLLHQAARFAVRQGASDLLCVMQSDNQALLPTVQRTGLRCRLRAATGSVEVRIPLNDVPPMDLVAVTPTAEGRQPPGHVPRTSDVGPV